MKAPLTHPSLTRQERGKRAYQDGLSAERQAISILERDGLQLLGQRLRTPLGEVDLIMGNADWLVAVEVKRRKTLTESAAALQPRQIQRLLASLEYLLATQPNWQRPNIRFDVLAVDSRGAYLHVKDALRQF